MGFIGFDFTRLRLTGKHGEREATTLAVFGVISTSQTDTEERIKPLRWSLLLRSVLRSDIGALCGHEGLTIPAGRTAGEGDEQEDEYQVSNTQEWRLVDTAGSNHGITSHFVIVSLARTAVKPWVVVGVVPEF